MPVLTYTPPIIDAPYSKVPQPTDAPHSLVKIPFSDLVNPTPELVKQLTHICETIGFFIITDHPIPLHLLHDVAENTRPFFQSPSAVKERFGQSEQRIEPSSFRGYSALEKLDAENQDSKALFDMGLDLPHRPGFRFRGPNNLPSEEEFPGFASSLYNLQKSVMDQMLLPVSRALSQVLGKDRHYLDESMKEPTLSQRVVYYPARAGYAGRHTDGCLFTLLFQEDGDKTDGHGSLKVHHNNEWLSVEANERDVIVNLGDTCQHLSGNRLRSTAHMVRHDGKQSRVSMPFFFYPNADAVFSIGDNGEKVRIIDELNSHFKGLWEDGVGAGRAKELTQTGG